MDITHIIGFIANFFNIIVFGQYDPVNFPDGPLLMEDSSAYDLAFEIMYMFGPLLG